MSYLPLNFAETFPPERLYLAKLLSFISKVSEKVSDQVISERTGIPTGIYSGKVKPTLNYLKGMWLIEPEGSWYKLTPFGKAVVNTDVIFSQVTTQIACHVNICDKKDGALLYNQLFSTIKPSKVYKKNEIEKILSLPSKPLTALVGMYTNAEGFEKCRILKDDKTELTFNPIPQYDELIPVFGALIVHLYNKYFPNKGQISVDDFDAETSFRKFLGWSSDDQLRILDLLSSRGYVNLSAQLNPVVFSIKIDEDDAWAKMYSEQK